MMDKVIAALAALGVGLLFYTIMSIIEANAHDPCRYQACRDVLDRLETCQGHVRCARLDAIAAEACVPEVPDAID